MALLLKLYLTDVPFLGSRTRWLIRQVRLVGVGSGSECGSKLLLLLCGFFASCAQDDRVNVKKASPFLVTTQNVFFLCV